MSRAVTINEINWSERDRSVRHNDVTENGVAFSWELAGPDGARFWLYREPEMTDEQMAAANNQLHRDRDVVGMIKVIRLEYRENG